MDNIHINLAPKVDRAALKQVKRAINNLEPGGEITITIESADAHQADPVIDLLEANGFDYYSKGSHDGNNYYINARHKKHY